MEASQIQLLGAGGFGAIIGWYVYYINRHRTGDVQYSDLVTVIGAIGGGTILTLFEAGTDLFGAYGIGLFCGFFGYFLVLVIWVARSEHFDSDWFLDGRRDRPTPDQVGGDNPGVGMVVGATGTTDESPKDPSK